VVFELTGWMRGLGSVLDAWVYRGIMLGIASDRDEQELSASFGAFPSDRSATANSIAAFCYNQWQENATFDFYAITFMLFAEGYGVSLPEAANYPFRADDS
jgi:hypothetical protein